MAKARLSLRRLSQAALAAIAVGSIIPRPAKAQALPAFAGAEGFGATTTGGRNISGSKVYVVSNLNDAGTGSFRDAVSHNGAIVVFGISGNITLASAVSVTSNVTILGQTAPGAGIAIQGRELSFSGSSNDIVQYIRAREGSGDPDAKASINLGDTSNMILDHVDAEYSQYDNIDAVGTNGCANVTIQNSLIADPIKAQQFNIHTEGSNTTYLNNVFANSHNRNPLAKSSSQFVNNLIYNYQGGFTTGDSAAVVSYDILNNYFVAGPSTTSAGDAWYQLDSNQSAYASGNLLDSNKDGVLNGSSTTPGGVKTLTSPWTPLTAKLPLLGTNAAVAFDEAHAGDSLTYDEVDTGIMGQVKSNGTSGSIYGTEKDTGYSNNGFGTITQVTSTNTLNGIPNAWAMTHGLSTSDTTAALKKNALGYDMVEQYAQEAGDEYNSQTWSAASGEWSTNAVNWSSTVPGVYDHALIRGNGTTNGNVSVTTASPTAFDLSIGGNGPAAGESLAVSTGGSLNIYNTIYVGDQNNATLAISGGTVTASSVQLGNTVWNATGTVATNYTGTLNLSGGTLQAVQIVKGSGTPGNWTGGGVFNWSGGTLQAGNTMLVNVPIALTAGSVTFDSNTYDATLSGNLTGTGGLTKISAGTLTLSGNNTYTGATIINGGALRAANNNSFNTQAIQVNSAYGLVLANGVTLSNVINVGGVGSNQFADVADANASATLAGNITISNGQQYRVGATGTGATITYTGNQSVNGDLFVATLGNIIFGGSGSLSGTGGFLVGRGATATNLTIKNAFAFRDNGTSAITLNNVVNNASGGITLTVQDTATFSAGNNDLELNGGGASASVVNLNGGTLAAAYFTDTASTSSTTLNFNGGTLLADTNSTNNLFLPALTGLSAKILAGGLKVNDNGNPITINQNLLTGALLDGGITKSGAGTTTLGGANTYKGTTTVSAGTLALASTGALPSGNAVTDNAALAVNANTTAGAITGTGTTTVSGITTLTAATLTQGTLVSNGATTITATTGGVDNLSGTGSLTLGASGQAATPVKTFTLTDTPGGSNNTIGAMTILPGSAMNLSDNALLVNYGSGSDPINTIKGYIVSGYAGGAWTGTGINSSLAAAQSSNYGIGYADAADNVVSGLATGTIDVQYALLGDANLDGVVDFNDFQLLARNFGSTGTSWDQGNFDYNTTTDFNDFQLLARNFGNSASLTSAQLTAMDQFAANFGDRLIPNVDGVGFDVVAVPEPAAMALLGFAGLGLLARQRKVR